MTTLFIRFAGDESGVTGIEYALIGLFITVVIVSAVKSVGTTLIPIFTSVAAGFS